MEGEGAKIEEHIDVFEIACLRLGEERRHIYVIEEYQNMKKRLSVLVGFYNPSDDT